MNCGSCMKKMSTLLAALAVIGLFAAAIYQSNFESQATLIQRIKPYDKATADLLGEAGTPIGSPQMMIVSDQNAFLPGKGEQGQRFVNDDYLKAHAIYPLQAKTVGYVGGLVKLALAGTALAGLLVAWWLGRRERSRGVACPSPMPIAESRDHGGFSTLAR